MRRKPLKIFCLNLGGSKLIFPCIDYIDFFTYQTLAILDFKVKTRSNHKNDIKIRILFVKLLQKIYSHVTVGALVQKLCFQCAAILDFRFSAGTIDLPIWFQSYSDSASLKTPKHKLSSFLTKVNMFALILVCKNNVNCSVLTFFTFFTATSKLYIIRARFWHQYTYRSLGHQTDIILCRKQITAGSPGNHSLPPPRIVLRKLRLWHSIFYLLIICFVCKSKILHKQHSETTLSINLVSITVTHSVTERKHYCAIQPNNSGHL